MSGWGDGGFGGAVGVGLQFFLDYSITISAHPEQEALLALGWMFQEGMGKAQDHKKAIDYYQEAGYLKEKVDLSKLIDTSFQEYAVQQLGPYKA